MYMQHVRLFGLALLLVGLFSLPLTASAILGLPSTGGFGTSFGGRVLFIVPCSGPMYQVTIRPAGKFPISYIYTPTTITNLVGPPLPGMQVLGIADIPFVCFIGGGFFSSPIPVFGLRMFVIGTSPPGGGSLLTI